MGGRLSVHDPCAALANAFAATRHGALLLAPSPVDTCLFSFKRLPMDRNGSSSSLYSTSSTPTSDMRKTDSLASLIKLMNQNPTEQVVYMTMTWDYVDGHPFKDDIKTVWLDVRQCGTSEINPPAGKNQFQVNYNWTANFDGDVVGSIGHVHDGGVNLKLAVDGKYRCENYAKYGTTPDYVQKSSDGAHGHGGMNHISEMKACHSAEIPVKQMTKGQVWSLTADYDFDKFPGMMREDKSWDEVMGIAITFVRRKGGA